MQTYNKISLFTSEFKTKSIRDQIVYIIKRLIINWLIIILQKQGHLMVFYLERKVFVILLCRVSHTRSAPVELPQGRKAARVNGRSGAMYVAYPLAELAQLARARDL